MSVANILNVQKKTRMQANGAGSTPASLASISPIDLLKPTDSFINRHLGPAGAKIEPMVKVLEVASLDELIEQTVPPIIRLNRPLDLPQPLSESEALADMRRLAAHNKVFRSFIGMGYYDCLTPPVIQRNILENPGWYTQYTPYQAEIALGRLEALLNFQTMVCDLTNMEVANAYIVGLEELDAANSALKALSDGFVKELGMNYQFLDGSVLADHLKDCEGVRDEDPTQLKQEFPALLSRLLLGAKRVDFGKRFPGRSSALVFPAIPYYGSNGEYPGAPVVIKIDAREKIRREQANYSQCIQRYNTGCSSQLHHALGRVMGMVSYQFLGTGLRNLCNFSDYWHQHDDPSDINYVLDNLIRVNCAFWYDNRKPRQILNLIQLYGETLNINWNTVWDSAVATGVDLKTKSLQFSSLASTFSNPKCWLESHNYTFFSLAWLSITHGDLNAENILVTTDGRPYLIDFSRTGWAHILLDIAILEGVIKYDLTRTNNLSEYWEFEQYLVNQERLDQPLDPSPSDPHFKSLKVIGYLRRLADRFIGSNPDMIEYNIALLLTTLNLLRYNFTREHHLKILLSASLLCENLSHQQLGLLLGEEKQSC